MYPRNYYLQDPKNPWLISMLPMAVSAQYYGYNPAYQNGNNMLQEQIRESNEQLRHQERMMMERVVCRQWKCCVLSKQLDTNRSVQ